MIDGSAVFLIALADDRMEVVFRRLARYPNGAKVIVEDGPGLVLVNAAPVANRRGKRIVEDDSCPIHPDTLATMWLAYLKVANRPVTCSLAPRFDVELGDLDPRETKKTPPK